MEQGGLVLRKFYEVKAKDQGHPIPTYAGKYELIESGIYEILVKLDGLFNTIPINMMFCSKKEKALLLSGQIDEDFHKVYEISKSVA